MKRIFLSHVILFAAISAVKASSSDLQQDTITITDSFLNMRIDQEATARLQRLQQSQRELNVQLESAKTNLGAKVEGASAKTLEQYNLRQDSICLDLRSQLIDVELQINEIVKGK